ncbi:MAG: hypothetical protein GY760_13980 [Deltaproteobacteria bacterium]|nr:hypothetical protein [Deltaproteobacteria bacterium]
MFGLNTSSLMMFLIPVVIVLIVITIVKSQKNTETNKPSKVFHSDRLFLCPDCDGKVSKRAISCPHCGLPMSEIINKGPV